MPKLKEQRLNQMIENALSYKQENVVSTPWAQYFQNHLRTALASSVVIASLILFVLVFMPEIQSQNTDHVAEIYEIVTLDIMDELMI